MTMRYRMFALQGAKDLARYNAIAERDGKEHAAPHTGDHRRTGRFDDGIRQRGGGRRLPHRAAGTGLRHPFGDRHAAALRGRDHRPHQGQHPVAGSRLPCPPRWTQGPSWISRARKNCWARGTCCIIHPARPNRCACRDALSADKEVEAVTNYLKKKYPCGLRRKSGGGDVQGNRQPHCGRGGDGRPAAKSGGDWWWNTTRPPYPCCRGGCALGTPAPRA